MLVLQATCTFFNPSCLCESLVLRVYTHSVSDVSVRHLLHSFLRKGNVSVRVLQATGNPTKRGSVNKDT